MAKKSNFLKGLLLGSFIGSAFGVLFAPKSGKEMRKELATKYKEAEKLVQQKVKELEPLTKEAYKKIVNEVTEALNRVKRWDKKELAEIKTRLLKLWKKPVKKGKTTKRKVVARKRVSR